jgi:hypothetical protein
MASAPLPIQQYSVRPVGDGYGVFDQHGHKVSNVFLRREDAVEEARAYLGGKGIVLVEDETGHVVGEHI